MAKYRQTNFPDYIDFSAAEDRDRIATALERIAGAQEELLKIAQEAGRQRKETAEKMKDMFTRPPETR